MPTMGRESTNEKIIKHPLSFPPQTKPALGKLFIGYFNISI